MHTHTHAYLPNIYALATNKKIDYIWFNKIIPLFLERNFPIVPNWNPVILGLTISIEKKKKKDRTHLLQIFRRVSVKKGHSTKFLFRRNSIVYTHNHIILCWLYFVFRGVAPSSPTCIVKDTYTNKPNKRSKKKKKTEISRSQWQIAEQILRML